MFIKKILLNSKYKIIIFDLDGVILNSDNNMRISWNEVVRKYNLKKKYSSYQKYVGLPFLSILKKLNIKHKKLEIQKFYKEQTIKNFKKIILYRGIKNFLKKLGLSNIKYSIVTSKDLSRTKMILNKFKLKPASIHCPIKGKKGKPHPYLINQCLKKNKISKNKACYVGDTFYDYLCAYRAGVDFIFHKRGFGKKKAKYILCYDSIAKLNKIVFKT